MASPGYATDTSGIAALCKHLTTNGSFASGSPVTLTQVEAFQGKAYRMSNAWLEAAGFDAPATDSTVTAWLAAYEDFGAAWLCESTQRTSGVVMDGRPINERAEGFRSAFLDLKEALLGEDPWARDFLEALGMEAARVSLAQGVAIREETAEGEEIEPLFWRGQFDSPGSDVDDA